MGMLLIIDGYNVLKRHDGKRTITEAERERFLTLVARYALLKRHEAQVFFDGGPSSYQTRQVRGDLTVIYAGAGRTADDCILELLDRAGRDAYLLVSSDRELVMAAEVCDIPSMDAETFYARITEVVGSAFSGGNILGGGAVKRPGCTSSPEVDALLAGTKVVGPKEAKVTSQKGASGRVPSKEREKKSKIERRLEKIARKL